MGHHSGAERRRGRIRAELPRYVDGLVEVGGLPSGTVGDVLAVTDDTAVWATLAVSIVAVWLAAMYLAAGLFGPRGGDPARTLAVRVGAVLALAGWASGS